MASTLIVDQLQKTGGSTTALTLPTSNASASQYLQNDGAGALSWATVTSETNNPYFSAYLSADQAVADNTWAKLLCNTVVAQTGSTYDNTTNYRWTPAVAGTYFVYQQVQMAFSGADDYNLNMFLSIYLNGVETITAELWQSAVSQNNTFTGTNTAIMVLSDTDYIESWARMDTYGGSGIFNGSVKRPTHFMGYRMII